MRKIIILLISCLLLSGCTSDIATTVVCSVEEWYMFVELEINYDKNDHPISLEYKMGANYEEFGEDLLETGYEAALSEVSSYNSYNGISYDVALDNLILTGIFTIDLTVVSEEDLNLIGITLEDVNLTPDDFIHLYELKEATCTKK